MNIFFYSARNADCSNGCSYTTCSQRCLAMLQERETLKEIKVLPGGSHFSTQQSMYLRSGDLVILYAGNSQELEDLISIKDVFESFRIVLVVGQEADIDEEKCHLLNPRYITSVGQQVAGLSEVVGRMTGVSNGEISSVSENGLLNGYGVSAPSTSGVVNLRKSKFL